MTSDLHKIQLSEFLKSCRGRLSPADFGLPETARRRTPGLRREDVAVLAGVSVTWYTWLEQGRDVRASARVLDNISSTLRLTTDERDYLFSLVQSRLAPLAVEQSPEVPPSVQRMINSLDLPAYVMTMKWDVLAWNPMVNAVFRDFGTIPKHRRNMIRILLVDDLRYQADPKEYDAIARRVLSKLRVDYSQSAGDAEFDAFIAEMMGTCPIFARLWGSTEIRTRSEGIHSVAHPVLGTIDYEHTSYAIEGCPTLRVVIFAPKNPQSAAKLRDIASEIHSQSTAPNIQQRAPKKVKRPYKKSALV